MEEQLGVDLICVWMDTVVYNMSVVCIVQDLLLGICVIVLMLFCTLIWAWFN